MEHALYESKSVIADRYDQRRAWAVCIKNDYVNVTYTTVSVHRMIDCTNLYKFFLARERAVSWDLRSESTGSARFTQETYFSSSNDAQWGLFWVITLFRMVFILLNIFRLSSQWWKPQRIKQRRAEKWIWADHVCVSSYLTSLNYLDNVSRNNQEKKN